MTPPDRPDAGKAAASGGGKVVVEADAADVDEQDKPVGPTSERAEPQRGMDVPEADALEQAIEVPLDDEAERP